MEIVMTLVFSLVMLVFMIYPAMKIVEFLETKMKIDDKMYDRLTVVLTIVLSLIIGLGLISVPAGLVASAFNKVRREE